MKMKKYVKHGVSITFFLMGLTFSGTVHADIVALFKSFINSRQSASPATNDKCADVLLSQADEVYKSLSKLKILSPDEEIILELQQPVRMHANTHPQNLVGPVDVMFRDFAKIWSSPPLFGQAEQDRIHSLVATRERKSTAAFNHSQLVQILGTDSAKIILDRTAEVLKNINLKNVLDGETVLIEAVAIHAEDAVNFDFFHRHGGGSITLAFLEVGQMTEIQGLAENENQTQTAFLTDGVLHRPRQNGSKRLIFFVVLKVSSKTGSLWIRP